MVVNPSESRPCGCGTAGCLFNPGLSVAPDARSVARANRAFLGRAVRYLTEHGVRQFIDLGTGIPTSPSVHEVARESRPDAVVVYVDNDPLVKVHNDAMLASDASVVTVEADILRPDDILDRPEVQGLIDFREPVGEPGLVPVQEWRPTMESIATRLVVEGAVARNP